MDEIVTEEPVTEVAADDSAKIVVTDAETVAVAKAMDPYDTLKWDSPDHNEVVACINAKEEARIFILGCRAVAKLEGGQLKVEEPAPAPELPADEVAADLPPSDELPPPPEDTLLPPPVPAQAPVAGVTGPA